MARDYLSVVTSLITKASDDSVGEAEREALMDAAFAMMKKHQIDMAMVNATAADSKDEQIMKPVQFANPYSTAHRTLFHVISMGFNVRMIVMHDSTCQVFGFKSDIETVIFLYTQLLVQAQGFLLNVEIPSYETAKAVRASWWKGYNYQIQERIKAATKKETDITPGSALVLYDRSKIVDAAVSEAFPKLRKLSGGRATSTAGFNQGKTDGSRANLGTSGQVGHNRRALT
jgi:hypothetical protein